SRPGPTMPIEIKATAMLDVDNAVPYLLEQGLIEQRWILDGALTLRCAARRNRNIMVQGPSDAGCLIKQPDELSPESRRTLAREADFYEFCWEEPTVAP